MRVAPLRTATATVAAVSLAAAAILAGCGDGDGEDESAGAGAPPASAFPAVDGRTLDEIVVEADASDRVVISPAGQVFTRGRNRFGFGVFALDRAQVTGAEVAIYAAPAKGGGSARGPYPARIESLKTDPAFTAQTTAADPDAAQVVYVSELDLDREGAWDLVGLVREDGSYSAARIPSIRVGDTRVPQPGEKAPAVHTPTEKDVADLSEIDTRDPHDTMHSDDLAEVLGRQPVVLVFATPRLCVSRVCGPVVDVAEQAKAERGDEAAFIHMEIFEDNEVDKGLREQVRAYNLPTEPWLFVIDANGRVSTAIEGAFGVSELNAALDRAGKARGD